MTHEHNRLNRAMRIADRIQALGHDSATAAELPASHRKLAAELSGAPNGYEPSDETWDLVCFLLRERERLARMTPAELFAV